MERQTSYASCTFLCKALFSVDLAIHLYIWCSQKSPDGDSNITHYRRRSCRLQGLHYFLVEPQFLALLSEVPDLQERCCFEQRLHLLQAVKGTGLESA